MRLVSLGRPGPRPDGGVDRCASTPRPGWTPAAMRDDSGGGGGGGWAAGWAAAAPGSRSPAAPRPAAASGCVLIIVVILLLKACGGIDLTGALSGGGTAGGYDTSRFTGDTAAYAELQDRPGRQRPARDLRRGGGRELAQRLLAAARSPEQSPTRSSSPRPRSTPSAARPPPAAARRRRRGPVLLPQRPAPSTSTPRSSRSPPGAAERPVRRVRRALRRRARVRPPHPEPARHDGQGEDPAGPEQRLGAPGAPGRLLRRHVGAGTPPAPTTPRATC